MFMLHVIIANLQRVAKKLKMLSNIFCKRFSFRVWRKADRRLLSTLN